MNGGGGHFFAKNRPAKIQNIFHVEHTQKTHLFALFHVFYLNITNKYFIKNIELTIGIDDRMIQNHNIFLQKCVFFLIFMFFRFLEKMSQKA